MTSPASAPAPSRISALKVRDFRVLMFATVLSNLVMPMQFISLTFWAVDTYPGEKVLVSGLIVAARGLGMLVFSFPGGALADRFERRKVLFACECAAFLLTGLMAFCMLARPFGDATIAAVLALVFISAANLAIDGPSRSSSIPVIVPKQQMGGAIALNNVAQQLAFPAILPLVGFLTGTIGPGKVVAFSLFAWVGILPLMALLRYSSVAAVGARRSDGILRDIRAGLSYTMKNTAILGIMAMIVAMQVVGMPGVGMLGPVWMTEVLGLSRTQFGFIAMLWGIGAFSSSVFFAAYNGPARRGTTLVVMVAVFALSAILFSHSRSAPLTAFANFFLGFSLTGALLTAITLIQYTVAEEMRGRVMGLFPLVMGLSMLNVAPVSYAGQGLGLEVVVPTLGWATLALVVVIALLAPGLRHARPALPLPEPVVPEPRPA